MAATTTSSTGQVSRLQQTTERLRLESSQLRERLRGERDAVRALRAQHAAELRAERKTARCRRVELEAQLQEVSKTKNTPSYTAACEQCVKNKTLHEAEIRKLNIEFKKKEQQLKGQLNDKETCINSSYSSCEQCTQAKALHDAEIRRLKTEFKRKEQQLKGQLNEKVLSTVTTSAIATSCEQCAKFKALNKAELRKLNVEFKKKEQQLKGQLKELKKVASVECTDGGICQTCQRLNADLAKQKEISKDLEERLQKAIDADRLKAADLRAQHEKHVTELSRITRANKHDAHKLLEELKTKDRIIAQLRRSTGRVRTKGEEAGIEHTQMRKLREEVRKNEQPALLSTACDPKPETLAHHDKFRQNEIELNVSIKQRDQMVCGAANEDLIEHPETDTDSAVSSAPSSLSPQPCSPAASTLRDRATPPPTSLSPQPSEGYTTPPPGLWPDLDSYDDDERGNSELSMARRQVRELERALLVTRATKSASRHVSALSERMRQLEEREAELLRELGDLREQNELLEFRVLELAECPDKSSFSTSTWCISERRDVATATDDVAERLNDEPMRKRLTVIASRTNDIEDKRCLMQILILLLGLDELSKRTEPYVETAMQIYNEREHTPPVSLTSVRGVRDRTGPDRDRLVAKVPPFTGRTAESDDDRESPLRSHESSTSPAPVNSRGTQTDVTETSSEEEDSTKSLNLTAEVRKLDKLRETIDRNGRLVVSASGCAGGCELKHAKQLEFYRERVEVLERKLCVYESSGELQARQLAERLSREVILEAQVKQLTATVHKLQSENSRLEEERCELEEAENDTRLRCQRLEADILQLERSRMSAKRRSRESRQQAAYWENMVSKYEERNYELEERECELRHRLEVMEKTAPAIMLFNMWKTLQDEPQLDVINATIDRLKHVGSRSRSRQDCHGDRSKSRSPRRNASCVCEEYQTEIKKIEEERNKTSCVCGNLEEKIKVLEIERQKLVNAKQDMEKKVVSLESQLTNLRQSATNTVAKSPSGGPSLTSLMSGDFELMNVVQELRERENQMKKRIEELEQRETAYMETLQQADEIWADMENGYKKRITDAEKSEADMRDRLHRKGKQDLVNYDELDAERELAARAERLSRENSRLQAENKRLERELCQCLSQDDKTREIELKADKLSGELERERRRSQALEQRLSDGEAALSEALHVHSSESETLRERLARTANELVHLEVTNGELREEVETLESKIAELDRASQERAATDGQIIRGLSQELNDRDKELADMKQKDSAAAAGERLGSALQGVKSCDVCSHSVNPDLVDTVEGVRTLCQLMSYQDSPPADAQVSSRDSKTKPCSRDSCINLSKKKEEVCSTKVCEQLLQQKSGQSSKVSSVSKLSSVDLESSGRTSRKTSKSGVSAVSEKTDEEAGDGDAGAAEAGSAPAAVVELQSSLKGSRTGICPNESVKASRSSLSTCIKKSCTGPCSKKSKDEVRNVIVTTPGGTASRITSAGSSKTAVGSKSPSKHSEKSICTIASCHAPCAPVKTSEISPVAMKLNKSVESTCKAPCAPSVKTSEICPVAMKLNKSVDSTCIPASCTASCSTSATVVGTETPSVEHFDLLTEVMVAGQPEYTSIQARVDMDTEHEIEGVTVMASVTDSGNLELTTESPPGLIEHTMTYTPSGNMEVTTGFSPRDSSDLDKVPSYFHREEEPLAPDIENQDQEPSLILPDAVSADPTIPRTASADEADVEPTRDYSGKDGSSQEKKSIVTFEDDKVYDTSDVTKATPGVEAGLAYDTSLHDVTKATPGVEAALAYDTSLHDVTKATPGVEAALAYDTSLHDVTKATPGVEAALAYDTSLHDVTKATPGVEAALAYDTSLHDVTKATPGVEAALAYDTSLDDVTKATPGVEASLAYDTPLDDVTKATPGVEAGLAYDTSLADVTKATPGVEACLECVDESSVVSSIPQKTSFSIASEKVPTSLDYVTETTTGIDEVSSMESSIPQKTSLSASDQIRTSSSGSGGSLVELLKEVAYSTEKIAEILDRESRFSSGRISTKSPSGKSSKELEKSLSEKTAKLSSEKISKELEKSLSEKTTKSSSEKTTKSSSEKITKSSSEKTAKSSSGTSYKSPSQTEVLESIASAKGIVEEVVEEEVEEEESSECSGCSENYSVSSKDKSDEGQKTVYMTPDGSRALDEDEKGKDQEVEEQEEPTKDLGFYGPTKDVEKITCACSTASQTVPRPKSESALCTCPIGIFPVDLYGQPPGSQQLLCVCTMYNQNQQQQQQPQQCMPPQMIQGGMPPQQMMPQQPMPSPYLQPYIPCPQYPPMSPPPFGYPGTSMPYGSSQFPPMQQQYLYQNTQGPPDICDPRCPGQSPPPPPEPCNLCIKYACPALARTIEQESAVGESAAGESAVGESAAGVSAAGESAVGESAAGESAAGESAVGVSAAGESAAGESVAGVSTAGGSAAGGSAAGGSTAGESTAEVSAVCNINIEGGANEQYESGAASLSISMDITVEEPMSPKSPSKSSSKPESLAVDSIQLEKGKSTPSTGKSTPSVGKSTPSVGKSTPSVGKSHASGGQAISVSSGSGIIEASTKISSKKSTPAESTPTTESVKESCLTKSSAGSKRSSTSSGSKIPVLVNHSQSSKSKSGDAYPGDSSPNRSPKSDSRVSSKSSKKNSDSGKASEKESLKSGVGPIANRSLQGSYHGKNCNCSVCKCNPCKDPRVPHHQKQDYNQTNISSCPKCLCEVCRCPNCIDSSKKKDTPVLISGGDGSAESSALNKKLLPHDFGLPCDCEECECGPCKDPIILSRTTGSQRSSPAGTSPMAQKTSGGLSPVSPGGTTPVALGSPGSTGSPGSATRRKSSVTFDVGKTQQDDTTIVLGSKDGNLQDETMVIFGPTDEHSNMQGTTSASDYFSTSSSHTYECAGCPEEENIPPLTECKDVVTEAGHSSLDSKKSSTVDEYSEGSVTDKKLVKGATTDVCIECSVGDEKLDKGATTDEFTECADITQGAPCPFGKSVTVGDRTIVINLPIPTTSTKSVTVCPYGHPINCECLQCTCNPCSKNIGAETQTPENDDVDGCPYTQSVQVGERKISILYPISAENNRILNICPIGHPVECDCIKCMCDRCNKNPAQDLPEKNDTSQQYSKNEGAPSVRDVSCCCDSTFGRVDAQSDTYKSVATTLSTGHPVDCNCAKCACVSSDTNKVAATIADDSSVCGTTPAHNISFNEPNAESTRIDANKIPSDTYKSAATTLSTEHPVDCNCVKCACVSSDTNKVAATMAKDSAHNTSLNQPKAETTQIYANTTFNQQATKSTQVANKDAVTMGDDSCPFMKSVQVESREIGIHYPLSSTTSRSVNICPSGHPVNCQCIKCICDPCSKNLPGTGSGNRQMVPHSALCDCPVCVCTPCAPPEPQTNRGANKKQDTGDTCICGEEDVADRSIGLHYPLSSTNSKALNVCSVCTCNPCAPPEPQTKQDKGDSCICGEEEIAPFMQSVHVADRSIGIHYPLSSTNSKALDECPCNPCAFSEPQLNHGGATGAAPKIIAAASVKKQNTGDSRDYREDVAPCPYMQTVHVSDRSIGIHYPVSSTSSRAVTVCPSGHPVDCQCIKCICNPCSEGATGTAPNKKQDTGGSCFCGEEETAPFMQSAHVSDRSIGIHYPLSSTNSKALNVCPVCTCNPCAPPEPQRIPERLPPSKLGPDFVKLSDKSLGSSKCQFEMGKKASVRSVAMKGTEDLRNLDSDTIKQKLMELEKDNRERVNEIANINKFMSGLQSQCACIQNVSGQSQMIDSRSCEQTISGLQCALAFLHEKCRKKDRMISAFSNELRLRADSGVFNSVLHNIAAEKELPSSPDFDRITAASTLPKPADMKSRQVMRTPAEKPCDPPVKHDSAPSDECYCNNSTSKGVDSSPLAVTDVRRISPDCLLLKWDRPASENIKGYEVEVNGEVKSRIHSAGRNATVLNGLEIVGTMNLSVIAISLDGDRCSPPATAVYEPHPPTSANEKKSKCTC